MFSGSIPALVTPFRNGEVDEDAFRRLVSWQIEEGSSALVPCGTTGESATLSYDEHYRVIGLCIAEADGRVPVIAGCGSNDTATAVRHIATPVGPGCGAGWRHAASAQIAWQAGAGRGTVVRYNHRT